MLNALLHTFWSNKQTGCFISQLYFYLLGPFALMTKNPHSQFCQVCYQSMHCLGKVEAKPSQQVEGHNNNPSNCVHAAFNRLAAGQRALPNTESWSKERQNGWLCSSLPNWSSCCTQFNKLNKRATCMASLFPLLLHGNIYINKEYNPKVFCLFACGQALTVSIKQMLEHHAANTNTILLMHFAVHKCSPFTTAGSLNFQLCNLTHPSCQRPTEGGLKFYRFRNQSASFMDKDQGDTRARSDGSKLLLKNKKTHTHRRRPGTATRRCKKWLLLKN